MWSATQRKQLFGRHFHIPRESGEDNVVRVSHTVGQMWSTLHSSNALRWYELFNHIMYDYGVTDKEMEDYIHLVMSVDKKGCEFMPI